MKRPLISYITFIPLIVLLGFIAFAAVSKTENLRERLMLVLDIKQFDKAVSPTLKDTTFDKYTFATLRKTDFPGSSITLGNVVKNEENFVSRIFYYKVDGLKVSGLLNMPKKEGTYPVLVMFRGYVDRKAYTVGEGSRHSGEVFAYKGFITLAPDFLGYGQSDMPSAKPLEERFQTYSAALTLLASIKNLNTALEKGKVNIKADPEKVAVWGHSNGGHIALSVLEITGKKYPASLWAPVSKPFPYSVLYYADEFDDHGKSLRKVIANFERDYDIEDYSPTNFFSWIQAPVQIHQGGADDAVPLTWSNALEKELKANNISVEYYTYPDEDHNFGHGSWPTLIERSVDFYKENF